MRSTDDLVNISGFSWLYIDFSPRLKPGGEVNS